MYIKDLHYTVVYCMQQHYFFKKKCRYTFIKKYFIADFPGGLMPTATAAAKSLQSCPTLCDPIPGILQARTLEWVAISFSNA